MTNTRALATSSMTSLNASGFSRIFTQNHLQTNRKEEVGASSRLSVGRAVLMPFTIDDTTRVLLGLRSEAKASMQNVASCMQSIQTVGSLSLPYRCIVTLSERANPR